MDKTYTETQGHSAFDWRRELKAAIKKEPCCTKHLTLIILAQTWITCACGNQCAIIPRYGDGRPRDMDLYHLGKLFFRTINGRNWTGALKTLAKIERRSAILITDELELLNQENHT